MENLITKLRGLDYLRISLIVGIVFFTALLITALYSYFAPTPKSTKQETEIAENSKIVKIPEISEISFVVKELSKLGDDSDKVYKSYEITLDNTLSEKSTVKYQPKEENKYDFEDKWNELSAIPFDELHVSTEDSVVYTEYKLQFVKDNGLYGYTKTVWNVDCVSDCYYHNDFFVAKFGEEAKKLTKKAFVSSSPSLAGVFQDRYYIFQSDISFGLKSTVLSYIDTENLQYVDFSNDFDHYYYAMNVYDTGQSYYLDPSMFVDEINGKIYFQGKNDKGGLTLNSYDLQLGTVSTVMELLSEGNDYNFTYIAPRNNILIEQTRVDVSPADWAEFYYIYDPLEESMIEIEVEPNYLGLLRCVSVVSGDYFCLGSKVEMTVMTNGLFHIDKEGKIVEHYPNLLDSDMIGNFSIDPRSFRVR